jgi:hypothetical protein
MKQPPTDHRELNRAKEDERADPRSDPQVGIGERYDVAE